MRRNATTALLAFGIACIAAVPSARAQQLLFDYVGFDFEDPKASAMPFGTVGNGYVGVGEVPFVAAPLVTDPANNQYTYHLTGLTSATRTAMSGFVVIDYSGPGTLTLYEDSKSSGTPFDYGVNPTNVTTPPSFVDGTAILVCSVTKFRYILNLATGSGSYDSELSVTGGSQYSNIPASQLNGWQFAGVTQNSVTIPTGYAHQVDGQTFLQLPTPTRASSWGQLKRSYR